MSSYFRLVLGAFYQHSIDRIQLFLRDTDQEKLTLEIKKYVAVLQRLVETSEYTPLVFTEIYLLDPIMSIIDALSSSLSRKKSYSHYKELYIDI